VVKTKKLVAFISGIKVEVRVRNQYVWSRLHESVHSTSDIRFASTVSTFTSAEINFLCAHKKLRSKRLAPVLIKEVTRRVNLKNIWQAVYTAGVVLPTPIGTCR
jgi:glycylpeptide N-tetradecanoyltransferase